MKILIQLLLLCLPVMAMKSHQEGNSYAKQLLEKNKTITQTTSPNVVPGYKTSSPKEADLTGKTIGNATVQETSRNEVAQLIKETSDTRESFKLDPENNPLFSAAAEVNKDPEKVMNEIVVQEEEEADPGEIHTCEEGGEDYTRSCHKHLEITLKITPEKKTTRSWCGGHWKSKTRGTKWYCAGCFHETNTTPKKVEVVKEEWVDDCQVLEDMADKGICRYSEKTESEKNETRTIQGEPIKRDHFEETFVYSCSQPTKNSCQPLKAIGCQQIKSTCKQHEGGRCVVWEQTYRCSSKRQTQKRYRATSMSSPFCLTGNCADSSYEANKEMLDALSQLSILRDIQKDIREKLAIFKGEVNKCSKYCLSFKDCCGSGKGWGTQMKLSKCKPEEERLGQLREDKKCVMVGTYCAEKKAGVCIKKHSSFCCFDTKLSRLIQEQGRSQLGMSWGDPKHPDCRGLKPEELSGLDFSKMDLRELYEDVQKNFTKKTPDEMSKSMTLDRVKENMKMKVEGVTNDKD